jgi:deoxyribonuclease-4
VTHDRSALGGRRIGPHLPLATGFRKAPDRALEIGASAIQIFTDNPTAWRRRTAPPPELDAFVARLREHDIGPVAIHAPYLVNLAGSDLDFWEKSVDTVVHEMETGRLYGAGFVNFHVGSHRKSTPAEGIARLAAGLAAVLDRLPDTADMPILVLENSAGGGDGIGSTVADLARILEAAVRAGIEERRIGFCLDTAHLWGAGYDLGTPEAVEVVFDAFDSEVGRARLVMLHLNDSRAALGSRADRHEHIGAGTIGYAGLRHLLTAPRLVNLPTFLETPGMDVGYDAVNMDRVRLLIAGEALPDLPPEAFETHGARSRSAPPGATAGTTSDDPPHGPQDIAEAAEAAA